MKEYPYILIIAGGTGTRVWPMSRANKPKQLLPLVSNKSLLQETIDRSLVLTSKENIYIGTNSHLKNSIQQDIPWIEDNNFIIEPIGRNTAPIIALFCAFLYKNNKDVHKPIVVLSSDHYISPLDLWQKAIESTFLNIQNYIYCIGIQPTSPNINYGYIEVGNQLDTNNQFFIKSFKEKPNVATAELYLSSGSFLWNSGMFVFTTSLFLNELERLNPIIFELVMKCVESPQNLEIFFPQMPDISIDYAVMEKSNKLAVVKGRFSWDDIGSFIAIKNVKKPDINGNFTSENLYYQSIHSTNNILLTNNSNIKFALLGINDLIIVENNGIIFIANEDNISSIKKIREMFPKEDH